MMSRGSNITYSSTIWPFFHLAIVVKNVSNRFPVGAIVPPSTARLEAVDRKQLGRPILETGRVEGPAACVRKPLSLHKVELRLFPFFDIEANPGLSPPEQQQPDRKDRRRSLIPGTAQRSEAQGGEA